MLVKIKQKCSCIFLIVGTASLWGQELPKKQVNPKDYESWSTLSDEIISADGNWISFKLNYKSASDTLFVQNTQSDKKWNFPNAENGTFSPDNKWWIAYNQKKGTAVLNLISGSIQWIQDVYKYEFTAGGNYVLMQKQDLQQEQTLSILNLETGKKKTIGGSTEHRLNAAGTRLAYVTKKENAIKLVNLQDNCSSETIMQQKQGRFTNLTWNSKGNGLAFLQQVNNETDKEITHKVYYLTELDRNPKSYCLDPLLQTAFFKGKRITMPFARDPIQIAEDGKRIFFNMASSLSLPEENATVQIWNSAAAENQDQSSDATKIPKLAVWWPDNNKLMQIGTNALPNALLTGKQNYALTFNTLAYQPQYEFEATPDFYLTNLKTGKSSLLVKKQLLAIGTIGASPNGVYSSYFKDKKWWVYDTLRGKATDVTTKITAPIDDQQFDMGGTVPSYGSPGWTEDGKNLLIYDQYDIWMVSPNGATAKRLTYGREQKIRFRIYQSLYESVTINSSANLKSHTFDLSNKMVLEALGDDKKSGYYYLYPNGNCEPIVYSDAKINTLRKAKTSDKYIYKEQSFTKAPQLKYWSQNNKKGTTIVTTNPQQQKYAWGHAELLKYSNPEGEQLNGILYYPANYQSGKKYPLIVHIYEKQSNSVHQYINPTQYNEDGFNPTNYTLNGYLVLYPDIKYELGFPGKSALNCVEAAVDRVKTMDIVEQNHIGLIGASFGGYETAFIVSQTNTFTTAVVGAACTDLVSNYLSMESDGGRSNIWRYESQQLRMGKSLFDNYKGYIENSPIAQAEKINTPLLIWTGKEDPSVNWSQSIELHLALQRLQKPHTFLVYPGQGHAISNPKSQLDLDNRIKEWFDFYLKEQKESENRL